MNTISESDFNYIMETESLLSPILERLDNLQIRNKVLLDSIINEFGEEMLNQYEYKEELNVIPRIIRSPNTKQPSPPHHLSTKRKVSSAIQNAINKYSDAINKHSNK